MKIGDKVKRKYPNKKNPNTSFQYFCFELDQIGEIWDIDQDSVYVKFSDKITGRVIDCDWPVNKATIVVISEEK